MRTVNIVTNGTVTNSNVLADDAHSIYHNGEKYVPCLLGGQWSNVLSTKLVTVPNSNQFSVL